jgi:hypothetical protein
MILNKNNNMRIAENANFREKFEKIPISKVVG